MQPTLVEQAELSQVKLVLATDGVLCPSEGTKCPSDDAKCHPDVAPNVPQNVPQNVAQKILRESGHSLSTRQWRLMQMIQEDSSVSREEMSLKMKVSLKTIARDIEEMRKYMSIAYVGGAVNGHWEIRELNEKEE